MIVQLASFLRLGHGNALRLQYTGYGHAIGVCLFAVDRPDSKTLICAASGVSRETAAALLLRRLVADARGFSGTIGDWCERADGVLAEKTQ